MVKKNTVLNCRNIPLYSEGIREGRIDTLADLCVEGIIDLETGAEKLDMDVEAFDAILRLRNPVWRKRREEEEAEEKAESAALTEGGDSEDSAEVTPEELAALLMRDPQKDAEALFEDADPNA